MIKKVVNMSRLMTIAVRMEGLILCESIQHCTVIIKSGGGYLSVGIDNLYGLFEFSKNRKEKQLTASQSDVGTGNEDITNAKVVNRPH